MVTIGIGPTEIRDCSLSPMRSRFQDDPSVLRRAVGAQRNRQSQLEGHVEARPRHARRTETESLRPLLPKNLIDELLELELAPSGDAEESSDFRRGHRAFGDSDRRLLHDVRVVLAYEVNQRPR